MKVQQVSLIPTQKALDAKCLGLTPELLAATGARYSRSNEGLDVIVSKIDWSNTDKSVDSIFRMVDYGHASIADMAPVAMFIDDISLYAAYYLWAQCPTASGQESSTRYIKMSRKGVMRPQDIGISDTKSYYRFVEKSFDHYEKALDLWSKYAASNPSVMHIPTEVLDDASEAGIKRRERMVRNFAFDRARVFLPVCAKTNVMLIMSARSWVELISTLLSHPLKEFVTMGTKMREQLDFVTPRLIRHAKYKQDSADVIAHTLLRTKQYKYRKVKNDGAFLTMHEAKKANLKKALIMRTNRYSICGDEVRSIGLHFGWEKVAFAEMRDLNRHRTGQKVATLRPNGFYNSADQTDNKQMKKQIESLTKLAMQQEHMMEKLLAKEDFRYFYYSLLGHTYRFEHTTTLDKFIYEAELRTGVGAHYRYAYHLRNCLNILYGLHPEIRGVVFEGSAEPE